MLVHLVHREHTLSLLGMQSLCRGAAVSGLPYGIQQDGLGVDRQTRDGRTLQGLQQWVGQDNSRTESLFSHSDC